MNRRPRDNDNDNDDGRRVRRRLNPEYVKLRVYSSNYKLPMSENRYEVFPMELVPTEIMVKLDTIPQLGERESIIPTFISTLTGTIFIYPPGVIFKQGNDYFLEISSDDLERTPNDMENWDGFDEGRSPGSIKIKINEENGALDHIGYPYMPDGPWKFYSIEPIGVDSVPGESAAGLLIPTDRRELQSAEETLREYRRERERIRRMIEEEGRNPFLQGRGSAAGFPIGGKRRRKKRTKKKSRRRKRKTLKKKRKRRKKKRKTRR